MDKESFVFKEADEIKDLYLIKNLASLMPSGLFLCPEFLGDQLHCYYQASVATLGSRFFIRLNNCVAANPGLVEESLTLSLTKNIIHIHAKRYSRFRYHKKRITTPTPGYRTYCF
jgi:hypothetical protein